jgi:rubredoxin
MSGDHRTKRDDLPLCPRCKAGQMVDVVTIAPLGHEPGLIAYECPKCGYVTSEVLPSRDRQPG